MSDKIEVGSKVRLTSPTPDQQSYRGEREVWGVRDGSAWISSPVFEEGVTVSLYRLELVKPRFEVGKSYYWWGTYGTERYDVVETKGDGADAIGWVHGPDGRVVPWCSSNRDYYVEVESGS